jgi:hypothetical protein
LGDLHHRCEDPIFDVVVQINVLGIIVKGDGKEFPTRVLLPFCDKVNVDVVKGCSGVGIIDYWC